MKDLKYLTAMSIPTTAVIGLYFQEYWLFITPVYTFAIIPILELLLPQNTANHEGSNREQKKHSRLFDCMLYLNIPIVFGLLVYSLYYAFMHSLHTYEVLGTVLTIGIVLGVNGINVAHELGHRQTAIERFLGKLLLLPSLYMHFYIEHNFGHHLHAATAQDPATARYNQPLYSFWISSVFGQYRNAWYIQLRLLKSNDLPWFSYKNDMLWYTLIQLLYLSIIGSLLGPPAILFAIGVAIVGFLLLETVNYIEHYGLLRKKLPSGRYERVSEIHSWNSNHVMGRIVLYELTRHSDHHYKSSKKYQLLDYHDISPQMPFGYPTSMVLSFIPPLWFAIMNPRIPKFMK